MAYQISFAKLVQVSHEGRYINECCHGGDLVSDQLLPVIRAGYTKVEANQEDWGWFIWFREGAVSLAVDIFCDDPRAGAFRLLLTSRPDRWFLPGRIKDTAELGRLKDLIVARLNEWVGSPVSVEHLDKPFL